MDFIGASKAIAAVLARAKIISANSEPFLIVGEAGTGRTHLARFIHFGSRRGAEPFVVFDAGDPGNIVTRLFGSVKSSLLGGENIVPGAIDAAGAGTLFIKNIQLMPLELQPQLLATVRLGGFRPAGKSATLKALCRFAFSLSPAQELFMKEKRLLPELMQFLGQQAVALPPLKERADDIEPLARYFTKKWCELLGYSERTLEKSALKLLKKGAKNISELQVLILNAIMGFKSTIIDASHIQSKIDGNWHAHTEDQLEEIALEDIVERKMRQFMERLGKYDVDNLHSAIMERVERPLIKLVMERTKGNQLRASKILGINRNTLRSKLERLEICRK